MHDPSKWVLITTLYSAVKDVYSSDFSSVVYVEAQQPTYTCTINAALQSSCSVTTCLIKLCNIAHANLNCYMFNLLPDKLSLAAVARVLTSVSSTISWHQKEKPGSKLTSFTALKHMH